MTDGPEKLPPRGGKAGGAGCGDADADQETTRFVAQCEPEESMYVVICASQVQEMLFTVVGSVGSGRKG